MSTEITLLKELVWLWESVCRCGYKWTWMPVEVVVGLNLQKYTANPNFQIVCVTTWLLHLKQSRQPVQATHWLNNITLNVTSSSDKVTWTGTTVCKMMRSNQGSSITGHIQQLQCPNREHKHTQPEDCQVMYHKNEETNQPLIRHLLKWHLNMTEEMMKVAVVINWMNCSTS